MFFVTTGKFSKEATKYGEETDVDLVDGKYLVELIEQYMGLSKQTPVVNTNEWRLTGYGFEQYFPADIDIK